MMCENVLKNGYHPFYDVEVECRSWGKNDQALCTHGNEPEKHEYAKIPVTLGFIILLQTVCRPSELVNV